MKVAIVGTTGLPGRYGGWDQLMINLVRELEPDIQFFVYTCKTNSTVGVDYFSSAKLHKMPFKANGWQSVFYDGLSIVHSALKGYDVVLVLGSSGCIFFPLLRATKIPIVWNMDGDESARSKWGFFAKFYLKLSKKFGLYFSDIVIADNKQLLLNLDTKHQLKAKMIAYGGDNASHVALSNETSEKYDISKKPYAFKVCRIVPENNIELILNAFSISGVRLIVVGNWNSSKFGVKLREKYIRYPQLTLLDAIYDQKTLDELRSNCCMYVHGHSVGGTNPSLVEAMHLGLSCIVYDVNYNRETTANKAVYFKDRNGLIEIIQMYVDAPDKFVGVGKALRSVSERRYSWSNISSDYKAVLCEARRSCRI